MERFPPSFKWSSEAKKSQVPLQCHGRNGMQKLKSSHDGQPVAPDKYLNISYLLFSTSKQHSVEAASTPTACGTGCSQKTCA